MMDSNAMLSTLSAISYNSTGWSDPKADMLNTVLKSHGIMVGAIQEHFQLPSNLAKITSKLNDYEMFAIPAHKHNDRIHKGRPSGGLSLLYHKKIQNLVSHIVVPNSNRVHAMTVKISQCKVVFINVYFPTDPRTINFNDVELIKTIQDIYFILNECGKDDKIIILGDLNADFGRNSGFVNRVKSFMQDNNFVTVWDKFPINFTYCHTTTRNLQVQHSVSTIDHFLVNEDFIDNCLEATVLHFAENISNHEILYLKLNCPHEISSCERNSQFFINDSPNWKKATPEQIYAFQNDLGDGLSNINIPDTALCCRSPHCPDYQLHRDLIEDYAINVINELDHAVLNNIPKMNFFEKRRDIPGWNEFIRPIREDMAFWYKIWIDSGKRVNSVVHQIYRNIRKEYIYALRRVRKHENEIRNEKFIEAAAQGGMVEMLNQLRKSRKTNNQVIPTAIDKVSGKHEICEHFKTIYRDIYNKHSSTTNLDVIIDAIEQNIGNESLVWLNKITPSLVSKLIRKLHSGKNDQAFKFKSDAFILSVDTICGPLSQLFKAFIIHGYIPDIFLSCTLIPLIKDKKKSKLISKNYRLIAISSIMLKLMDLLLLDLFGINLSAANMQFGFQTKSSTSLCSWTLRESINFYINQGSPVYVCMLDMTKAFDHVRLDILFHKLKNRIPGLFLRFLIYTYTNQQCTVKWDGSVSSSFTIGNGVRQGAVLSPVLFNLYMDELFTVLRESDIGCKIDQFYYGCIGYADDFCLLCPTRSGLQKMVDITKDYCDHHGITISTDVNVEKSKTKCLCFNNDSNLEHIILYGRPLPWVDSHMHLGHTIHINERNDCDILIQRAEFISNIHALYQELGNIPPQIFLSLVNIYFTSFYGSVLWDLEGDVAKRLYSTWNFNIRNTFDLPFGTHRYILHALSNRPPLEVSFSRRFIKFCAQITNSNKPEVLHLYHKQKYDLRSTFGRNFSNIILNKKNYYLNYTCPVGDEWKIPTIKELLEIKNNNRTLDFFTTDDIQFILRNLCCL